MTKEAYYNRVMSEGLEKFLKDEKDIKGNWLIDFVKSHKELDFQTGTNENKQGTRRSWFSIYRGTSRILRLSCGVREKLVIDADKAYMDLDKDFYDTKHWEKHDVETLKLRLRELMNKIGNNKEQFGQYYINENEKKMEGYYQNLVSRKYTFNWSHSEKLKGLVIFDKEFQIGNLPNLKEYDKSWADGIIENISENSHEQCDFVGINNKGDIVLLEVKRKADEEKLALAPLQVATYYKILRQHLENEGLLKLQQVIFDMIKQKKDLGLINKDYELPQKLSGKIQLAVVVGGKNINPDTIAKFKIVKEAVIGCKIPEIDYYTCGEDGSIELVEDLDSLKNFDGYDINDDSYKNNEMAWQAKLICADKDKKREEQVFDGAQGGGLYDGKAYSHVLQCGKKNLFEWIRDKEKFPQYKSAIDYFDANEITWHKGGVEKIVGNTLSSQIACLNHLFAIREDEEAVRAMINGIYDIKFESVEKITYDKCHKGYIAFEVIDENNKLKERGHRRGSYCTSIDALVCAVDKDQNKWLIMIEWKYTETYGNKDYSTDDGKGPKDENKTGKARMKLYDHLIKDSDYLERPKDDKYQGSIYYQEPFYQLMRQTLWAEQVIKHGLSSEDENAEPMEAVEYLHIHVIPKDNDEFRRGGETEQIWTSMLTEEGKKRYKTIDPEELLAPIADEKKFPKYTSLINYLRTRYWDRPSETTNDNQNPSAK